MLSVPIKLLRCPATGQSLIRDGAVLRTADRSRAYPIAHEVPVLIDDELSLFTANEVMAHAYLETKTSLPRRLVRRALPGRSISPGLEHRVRRFATEVTAGAQTMPARVLVIGGGRTGAGMGTLVADPDLEVVDTDVYLGPRVSVVCDGHHLPFVDESFDGVVVQAVLEHVVDPARVVQEIHRVLGPRGIVFAETPFMQQVHEGPYDFTRWTESGHRRLFRMFTALDRGAVAGPGTTLLWSLCYFARAIPRRHSKMALVLDKATECCFFWLKYCDKVLLRNRAAIDGASGVYFLGRKSSSAVSDREIVAGYLGTVGRPVRRK
jgi:SAM-dependent methyltransferase